MNALIQRGIPRWFRFLCVLCVLMPAAYLFFNNQLNTVLGADESAAIGALAWNKQGTLAIGYGDGVVQLKDVRGGTSRLDIGSLGIAGPPSADRGVQVDQSAPGQKNILLVTSLVWNPTNDQQLAIAVQGNNTLGFIIVWNVKTNKTTHTDLNGEPMGAIVRDVGWSADGKQIDAIFVSGFGGGSSAFVNVFDAGTLTAAVTLAPGDISDSAWRPNQAHQLASIDREGQVTLLDVSTQAPVVTFSVLQELVALQTAQDQASGAALVTTFAWSPDGKLLAVLGQYNSADLNTGSGLVNAELQIWDVDAQKVALTVSVAVTDNFLAWSSDGTRLAISGYRLIQILDAKTGALTAVKALNASDQLTAFAWKPNSKTLAIGTTSGSSAHPNNKQSTIEIEDEKLEKLTLKPLCTVDPNVVLWRVENPNRVDVPFTWSVGNQPGGGLVAPAAHADKAGRVVFEVPVTPNQSNTVQIAVGIAQQDSQDASANLNSLAQCTSDQIPTPIGADGQPMPGGE